MKTRPLPPSEEPEKPCGLAAELITRGVSPDVAVDLVKRYAAEVIGLKLDVFDWLGERNDKRISKSPQGYLVTSIIKNYPVPKHFVSREERIKEQETKEAKKRQKDAGRAAERRQEQLRKAVNAFIDTLTPPERAAWEAQALDAASEESRQNYDSPVMTKFRSTLLLSMLREFVTAKIEAGELATPKA